jgi:hypothetical protein
MNPSSMRLEHRLEESARALVLTSAVLREYTAKDRDENTPLTKEGAPVRPTLIFKATDQGGYKPYADAIRMMRLDIEIRANAKSQGGDAGALDAICAAMESLLDGTNLKTALDSPTTWMVAVMMARRQPGCSFATEGLIRKQTYSLDIRCVRAEMTEG